ADAGSRAISGDRTLNLRLLAQPRQLGARVNQDEIGPLALHIASEGSEVVFIPPEQTRLRGAARTGQLGMRADGNVHAGARTGPTAADVPHKRVAGEEVGSQRDHAGMWRGDSLHRLGQAADRLDAGHGVEL